MMSRRAVSLVEVMVALVLLAVGVVAMMSLSTQEGRNVALTEERQLAQMLLMELQEAFGGASLEFYEARGLPPSPQGTETFTELHESLLEDHAAILNTEDPGPDEPAARGLLRERLAPLRIQRAVYLDPFVTGAGTPGGVVTMMVRYTNRAGEPREVSSHQVVYGSR